MQFPEPTGPAAPRAEVLLTYLDYFRSTLVEKVQALPPSELRTSRLPSGWTPVEILRHVAYVERRWLEWGFEDPGLPDPWGDRRDDRWYVSPDESLTAIVARLEETGARSRDIVRRHLLSDTGEPGERWGSSDPATLERVLLHLLQEFARHTGHVDIVAELAGGPVGE